jgi:hypothetical protein
MNNMIHLPQICLSFLDFFHRLGGKEILWEKRNFGDCEKIVNGFQPRTQGLPARFFNMAAKAGEAPVNAGHVSGKYSKILGVLAYERALWK